MRLTLIAPTSLPSRRANTIQVMKMADAIAGLGHEIVVLVPHAGAVIATVITGAGGKYSRLNGDFIPE